MKACSLKSPTSLLCCPMDKISGYSIAASGSLVAITLGAYYLSSRGQTALEYPVNVDAQGVEAEPGVRCCPLFPDGPLSDGMLNGHKTMYDGFKQGEKRSKDGKCLGHRRDQDGPYRWLKYSEVEARAYHFGSWLVHVGFAPGSKSMIGIYSVNRPEWVIVDQACGMYSMVTVPLYDTLGADACGFIINQTEMSVVVVDKSEKAINLLKDAATGVTKTIKLVVVFEEVTSELINIAEKLHVTVTSFFDALTVGEENSKEIVRPDADTLATLCYTSGTTGNPKGVMLTHGNLASSVGAMERHLKPVHVLGPEDIHISYLPLAHIYERIIQGFVLANGGQIGFYSGNVTNLMDDMQELKPTLFITVPRLLMKIYDRVMQGARSSFIRNQLFKMAFSRKKSLMDRGIFTRSSLWDKLVFSKIQNLMGGNVKLCLVGAAPLAPDILEFTRVALGCVVIEGYGQTESTGAISATIPSETKAGNVGIPISDNNLKLIDVPDMGYFSKDNKGELCFKGSNATKGYYKEPAKTAELIDEDGWIHTGDIGEWLPTGQLRLIDRRKHIFKLAQGEYVAPEKLEGIYMLSSYIAQIFVDGNSLQVYPFAIVIPDESVLVAWAKKKNMPQDMKILCKDERVEKLILEDMAKIGTEKKLKGFEQVKDIIVHPDMFCVDNGLLTPTFKAKRPEIRQHFKAEIAALYKKKT